jgi:hypothetical protein
VLLAREARSGCQHATVQWLVGTAIAVVLAVVAVLTWRRGHPRVKVELKRGDRVLFARGTDVAGWPTVDVVVTNLAHVTTVTVTAVEIEARGAGVVYKHMSGPTLPRPIPGLSPEQWDAQTTYLANAAGVKVGSARQVRARVTLAHGRKTYTSPWEWLTEADLKS